MAVDFIVTWVDESDEIWLEKKNSYKKNKEKSDIARYRDWGNMRYWFRGIEKNAPWANNIFFVSDGQIPKWLNTNHPQIKIMDHTEYIDKKYLPTFNSRTIELNFHKITNLSDQFVYFNDDMFLINPTTEEDFFKNGFPRDCAIFNPVNPSFESIAHIILTDMQIINKYFKKNEIMKKNLTKFLSYKYGKNLIRTILLNFWPEFVGFYESHLPVSYNKATFINLWKLEKNILEKTCFHKFRDDSNVNHWVMRYWQLASGEFIPRFNGFGKFFEVSNDNISDIEKIIMGKHIKVLCLNDSCRLKNFENTRKEIQNIFEKKFPQKSSFEID